MEVLTLAITASDIACRALQVYYIIVIARILLSWFSISPGSPIAGISSILIDLTEPILGPIRRLMPPIGGESLRLDLSPLIVMFGIMILRSAIC
ncbi:MAG: YggT family protein [Actinobacteria bacterium]|nr:YggT family protein [Actinomycetota bacterium]MCB9388941.1 YggT family protein [Acidimicrobiia bacterium]